MCIYEDDDDAETFGGGSSLPQYKPYETDDSNNILNFFNTICINPLQSSLTVYGPLV